MQRNKRRRLRSKGAKQSKNFDSSKSGRFYSFLLENPGEMCEKANRKTMAYLSSSPFSVWWKESTPAFYLYGDACLHLIHIQERHVLLKIRSPHLESSRFFSGPLSDCEVRSSREELARGVRTPGKSCDRPYFVFTDRSVITPLRTRGGDENPSIG